MGRVVTLPSSTSGLRLLSRYGDSMQRVAGQRKKGGARLQELDAWQQTALPAAVAAKGSTAGLAHRDVVQTMEWKLARGKWRPRLLSFVQALPPAEAERVVKDAFAVLAAVKEEEEEEDRVDEAVREAVAVLTTLKGVGPATASAYLVVAFPGLVPFAEDSSLRLVLGKSKLDYSMDEIVLHARRLRRVAKAWAAAAGKPVTAHDVELALFALHNLDEADEDVVKARADSVDHDFDVEDGGGDHYDSMTEEEESAEVVPVSKRRRKA